MTDFMKQLQDGDESAWIRFAEVMQPIILNKIKRVVDDDEKANDVASDIMVALIATIGSVLPPESSTS